MLNTAITVNQILTRVMTEVGLTAESDPFASSEQPVTQLKALLQTCCEELVLGRNWEFLTGELAITSPVSPTGIFDLPEDFIQMIDNTAWCLDTELPVWGPLSQQELAALVVTDTVSLIQYGYRLVGSQLEIYPIPPEGVQFTFAYQTRYFVKDGLDQSWKANFDKGSDLIIFDRTLITRYLRLAWLTAKGFDTTSALASFVTVYDMLTGKDKGGQTLSAGRTYGFPYLGNKNIPWTGYGQ